MISTIRSLGLYLLVIFALVLHYGLLKFSDPVLWAGQIVFAIAAYYLAFRLLYFWQYHILLTRSDMVAGILLLICWIAVFYNIEFRPEAYDADGLPAIVQVRNHLIFGMIWMFVGAAASLHTAKRSDIVALLLLGGLGFAIFSGVQSTEGGFTIDYSRLTAAEFTSDEKVSHLTFGYLATIIYALAYGYAKRLRPVVFVLGAMVIFPLESRSAFFITPVAILAFEYLSGKSRRFSRVLLPMIIAGIAVIGVYYSGLIDFDDERNQRMIFAEGVEEDGSAEGRSDILSRSLKALPSQALFGDPTFMVTEFGDLGSFIHNLLSAWQYFGLPAFLFFIYALWFCLKRGVRASRQGHMDPVKTMGLIVLLYIILGISTTHFVAHRLLWFSLGFWLLQLTPHPAGRLRRSGGLLSGLSMSNLRRRKNRRSKRRRRSHA